MTVRWFYMDPDAVAIELSDRVWTPLDVHSSAEEFNAVQSTLVIEDWYSDLELYAFRRMYCLDDDAPEDRTVIWMGSIADVHIKRSEMVAPTATSRAWHLTLTDLNYAVVYPRFDSNDTPNRPAETVDERIAWYLTTAEGTFYEDNLAYIASSSANLDARDLDGETPHDMLSDALTASRFNGFVLYDEAQGPPDFDISTGELALYLASVGAELWESDAFLSNDLADINAGALALATANEDLHLDPTRINFRLHAEYDGGSVAVEDLAIAANYTRREASVYLPLVTNETSATNRADAMLADGSTPQDRISWGYIADAEHVNDILVGQSFMYRATHLGNLTYLGSPDYTQEGGVRLRSLTRSVKEIAPNVYEVTGDAVVAEEAAVVPVLDCREWSESIAIGADIGIFTTRPSGPAHGPIENIADGLQTTYSAYGSFIAGAGDWVQGWTVDLGAVYDISKISVTKSPIGSQWPPSRMQLSLDSVSWYIVAPAPFGTADDPPDLHWENPGPDGGGPIEMRTWTPGPFPYAARYIRVYRESSNAGLSYVGGCRLNEILICGELAE